MSRAVRIGALKGLIHQPVVYGIKSSPELGELFFNTAPAHIEGLMNKELDVAFINPIDYALNSSDLIIYPSSAIVSSGFSDTIRLYLRKDLKTISTMAINQTSAAEVILARIVLAEKYESEPAIVPVIGDVDAMLAKADAALIVGDEVFKTHSQHPFIDLVDEWSDITELPYVHALCVSRTEAYNKEISETLIRARDTGIKNFSAIAYDQNTHVHIAPDDLLNVFSHISYSFSDEIRASLDELFRLAFFHGILKDIPEINIAH